MIKLLPIAGGNFFVWVRAIPDIVKLVKEVVLFIKAVDDYYTRWQLTKDFKEAIEKARTTGDTSNLENLLRMESSRVYKCIKYLWL